MTISNQTNRTSAVGNAAVGQEVPFLFPIEATSELAVISRVITTGVETTLAETTNYTVVIDNGSGGTVTTVTAVASTSEIHIIRNTPFTQTLDLEQGGSFGAESQESAYDRNTKLAIALKDAIDRIAKGSDTDPTSAIGNWPNSIDRKSKVAAWDSAGKPTAITAVPEGSVAFSGFGETIAEAADASTARGLLELDTDDDVEFAAFTATDVITKGPWFDIRAYGAVEDGATDASTAIQAAIDAAEQSAVIDKGRGVVLIPTVTGSGYKCTSDINLKDQIIITGGGIIEFATTKGFVSNAKSGWVIDGITILGSDTVNQIGIYCHNNSVKFWIRNCQFYGFQTGIFVTKCFIFRIDDNDMYLFSIINIVCIKITSGEGNCTKGTAYATVNDVKIRGNMFKEFGSSPSATPLIHIGDSALAPVDPKAVTHAKNIDISANQFDGQLSNSAIRIENTKMVTIERNWFETFNGPCVYMAGQFHNNPVIRANGFYGNNSDDQMDPAIKLDSTVSFNTHNVTIAQNNFDKIHANHNFLELDNAVGLVIDNNFGIVQARVLLTDCTGVDFREPKWIENQMFHESDELVYENEFMTYTTFL